MLTPAFHFKILEDFVQVFNEQSKTLIGKLSEAVKDGEHFNIYPYVTRCTLDIICGKCSSTYLFFTEKNLNIYRKCHGSPR